MTTQFLEYRWTDGAGRSRVTFYQLEAEFRTESGILALAENAPAVVHGVIIRLTDCWGWFLECDEGSVSGEPLIITVSDIRYQTYKIEKVVSDD